MKPTHEKLALRVSTQTIAANTVLIALKLTAGLLSRSSAMVSDAVHSISDVLSTVVVMIGVKMSAKASDRDHPYGHERMEPIAAIVLAGILCATGLGIGYASVRDILNNNPGSFGAFGGLALAAAAVSVVVKEGMFWYTRAAAKKIGSGALMADAWHHRSDALSSVGSFAGILGARLGFPLLDPLAGMVICLFVVKAAYDIFRDAVGKMTDKSCDDATVYKIYGMVRAQEGVLQVDSLKTRRFGDKIYVDVEIGMDADISLRRSHDVAQAVHDRLEMNMPEIKHCMVHVNPVDSTDRGEMCDQAGVCDRVNSD